MSTVHLHETSSKIKFHSPLVSPVEGVLSQRSWPHLLLLRHLKCQCIFYNNFILYTFNRCIATWWCFLCPGCGGRCVCRFSETTIGCLRRTESVNDVLVLVGHFPQFWHKPKKKHYVTHLDFQILLFSTLPIGHAKYIKHGEHSTMYSEQHNRTQCTVSNHSDKTAWKEHWSTNCNINVPIFWIYL